MPTFTYTARDRTGNVTSGTVDADSNSLAAAHLREQGLWVTDLRTSGGMRRETPAPGGAVDRSVSKRMWNPVSLRDLALFYRQLQTLLHSGMSLYQSLDTLSNPAQTPNAPLRRVTAEIARNVLEGRRVSEAMARYPWLFDKMQVRMVEAGEAGGMLVEILRRLADYVERAYELRLEIKRKTLYPKLLLAALLFIPPIPTLVFHGPIAYLAEVFGIIGWVLLFGIPLMFAMRVFLSTEAGRAGYDRVKLAIPVIGPLVRKIAVARFARTLAALYGAGVPIASALGMAGEACGNAVLERQSRMMVPALERGTSIAQALSASGFFPPMVTGMVSTGETSGNLDTMLDKAADFYENEAMHATVQIVVILGVLLLLIMAIMIAIKVIGFYSGLYGSIQTSVSGAAGGGE